MPATIDSQADFQEFRQDVYRWAFRVVGHHHDALDVTQDVFLRWLRQQREHATPDHPRSWLRRVTINRAIDLVRAGRDKMQVSIETPAGPAPRYSPDEHAELRLIIAGAMDRLPEMQRCVLVARVYDELTFTDIAREHGIAVPTAKTHYLRALASVRDQLERYGK